VDTGLEISVGVAAGIFVFCLVAGLVLTGLAGLRLWRTLRAAQRRVGPMTEELSLAMTHVEEGVAGLESRAAELGEESEHLRHRAEVAAVIGKNALLVAAAVKLPLRFLTGR
jgi:hypothetical protein